MSSVDVSGSSTPQEEAGPQRAGSAPEELASDLADAYDEVRSSILALLSCTHEAFTQTLPFVDTVKYAGW